MDFFSCYINKKTLGKELLENSFEIGVFYLTATHTLYFNQSDTYIHLK